MSKIPSDDVLESMYKLRIRESAQLKTVLELYEMEDSSEDIDAQLSKIVRYHIRTHGSTSGMPVH